MRVQEARSNKIHLTDTGSRASCTRLRLAVRRLVTGATSVCPGPKELKGGKGRPKGTKGRKGVPKWSPGPFAMIDCFAHLDSHFRDDV